jgi:hypothetical protein
MSRKHVDKCVGAAKLVPLEKWHGTIPVGCGNYEHFVLIPHFIHS